MSSDDGQWDSEERRKIIEQRHAECAELQALVEQSERQIERLERLAAAAEEAEPGSTAAPPHPPSASAPSAAPPAHHPLLAGIVQTLGPALAARIAAAPILLIGAGGIGCELLKNLALSGFTRVTVVDLDTVDVSNLNRQFLFRSRHVGMPKCVVACEAGRALAPTSSSGSKGGGQVRYEALHGNVCDADRFNVAYISKFALVLNALDNVAARRRVNRLW